VTQAYTNYKKEVVMDTEEELKLERLEAEREKALNIVKEDLEKLPQNGGNSLHAKFREIESKENEYREFREDLKSKRQNLSELDYLDEMINDFNYMMFHQHLFGELNEYELAKRDLIFNSPGLDLLF
jgi:DNA repair exonuclease SbcCD ATPase subunit